MINQFPFTRYLSVIGISSTVILSTLLTLTGAAASRSTDTLFNDLQLAICLNNWDTAVNVAGALIADPTLTDNYRDELVSLRRQLQTYQQRNSSVVPPPGCDALISRYVVAVPTHDRSLNWDAAFFSAFGADQLPSTPDQLVRQRTAAERAGLTAVQDTPLAALSPALLIQTPIGTGVSAGTVARDIDVFSFLGREDDQITLTVNVTDVLPGLLYTDDDSQIFLFNSDGTLLTENDDLSRLQSQITNFVLPTTGIYYVAVTTYNNDPILNTDRQITGWTGNGGSAIRYTITVRGLTPSEQFISPTATQ